MAPAMLGTALVVLGSSGIVLLLALAWWSQGRAPTAHAGRVLVCAGAIVTGRVVLAPFAHPEWLVLALSLLVVGAWLACVGRHEA